MSPVTLPRYAGGLVTELVKLRCVELLEQEPELVASVARDPGLA